MIEIVIKYFPATVLKFLAKISRSTRRRCLWNTILESGRHYPANRKIGRGSNAHRRPTVVFFNCEHGGITDRFKAAVSLFDFCDKHSIEFRIFSKNPFDFDKYFQPAEYDWTIDQNMVNVAYGQSMALDLYFPLSAWEDQQYVLKKLIKLKQIGYIFVHASAPYGLPSFASRFRQLFSLRPAISNKINDVVEQLDEFVSVSFRFVTLLDDSEEIVEGFSPLPDDEKEKLINECFAWIRKISSESHCNVLVTTDSPTFSRFVRSMGENCIMCLEAGNIHHHVGYVPIIQEAEISKQFMDFFLISFAQKAYQIQIGPMYESKFPKWAASLNDVPYSLIRI